MLPQYQLYHQVYQRAPSAKMPNKQTNSANEENVKKF